MKKLTLICALFFINMKMANSGCCAWFAGCTETCKNIKDVFCSNDGNDRVVVNITNANSANNSPEPYQQQNDENIINTPKIRNTHTTQNNTFRSSTQSDSQSPTIIFHDTLPFSTCTRERSGTMPSTRISRGYILTPIPLSEDQNSHRKSHEYEMITFTQDDSASCEKTCQERSTVFQEHTHEEIYFLHERNIEYQIKKAIYKTLPENIKNKFTTDMNIEDFINLCNKQLNHLKSEAKKYNQKDMKYISNISKAEKYQLVLDQIANMQLLFRKFSDNPVVFKADRTQNHREIQLISEINMQKYINIALEKPHHEFYAVIANLEYLNVIFHSNPPEKLHQLAVTQNTSDFQKSLREIMNLKNNHQITPN